MSDKKKKSLKNLICAGLFGLVVLSGARGARGTCVDSNSVVSDGIEYYMQTDKAVYSLGENVEMLYRLTNLSYSRTVTFEFSNIQQWSFEVRDDATTIWRWPKHFNPALSSLTLYPRDVKGFCIEWDMMNDNTGSLVIPGTYNVIGALNYGPSHPGYLPVAVQIEIMEGPYCGDANHPYPAGDLNHDCRVNLLDLAILASHWLECTVPECDLAVSESDITFSNPNPASGEEVTMTVTVHNIGGVDAGEFVVYLSVSCSPDGVIWTIPMPLESVTVPHLSAGSSTIIYNRNVLFPCCMCEIMVWVDREHQIQESNEGNNHTAKQIEIQP